MSSLHAVGEYTFSIKEKRTFDINDSSQLKRAEETSDDYKNIMRISCLTNGRCINGNQNKR